MFNVVLINDDRRVIKLMSVFDFRVIVKNRIRKIFFFFYDN